MLIVQIPLCSTVIGQFPNTFTAAVMRNPVIAAGDMIANTDIPDWCFAEFDQGDEFTLGNPEESDHLTDGSRLAAYEALQEASPISSVGDVEAPVLLLIGEQDQRVPPSQGKNYYHSLRERGKVVDMLCFPASSHPLDQVETAQMSL